MAQISERFEQLGADGEPAKLGILGGTFDPIHIGHLRIAEEVREQLGLDAVLFVPAGNPVFKRERHITDARVRLQQVKAAVAGNPHFDASPVEVDREGDTFTVDTLRQLRSHYPDNVVFYFIVGDDAAASIGKWRGCADIAALAHLVVATGRPGTEDEERVRAAVLEAAPFEAHFVKVSSLEVSSSDIRERLGRGDSVRYLVPDVLGLSCGEPFAPTSANPADQGFEQEALTDAFLEARREELAGRVSPKRFKHSLGVSEACVRLARAYGVDERKARLAGLLHDWDKGMDDDEARARVRELHMEDAVDPWVVEHMPRVLHGYTAARALKRDFPGIPAEVLQAIDRHTTAAVDMGPLDMVLYIADAIEPSREFGRIEQLRGLVGKVTLEELYFETYEYWTFLLFERRAPLHPDTMRIWNANVLRRNAGKPPYVKGGTRGDGKPGKHGKPAGKSGKPGKAGKSGKDAEGKRKKKREGKRER